MYTTGFLGVILANTFYISLTSATITLSQFQRVTGFPSACQNAYDAPISGCDASNFPQKCSSQCFFALAEAEALIDNSCAGQQAPFNSIIGQMFEGNGPTFMCTSDFSLESSGGSSSTGYYTDATSSSSTTTPSIPSTSTSSVFVITTRKSSSSTKSKAGSTITTSSTVHRTSTVAELTSSNTSPSSTTSSSSSSPLSTSTNTPPSKGSSTATFLSTIFNNGQATTLTSQAQRTSAANSNPDAFGGGGSPFEVGPNGNGGEKAGADFWLLLSAVFGVVVLMR